MAATRPAPFDPARPAPYAANRPLTAPAPFTATRPHAAPAPAPSGSAAGEQDVMLMPGQLYFGSRARTVKTLVGSCVAITLWHPVQRIGGMCHYLLPSRRRSADSDLDGRYGDEAMEMLVKALRRAGTEPHDYQAHLYGGADTMPDQVEARLGIGERNIEQGWTMIDRWGFQLMGVDVGETVPRQVNLELATGAVHMRRGGRA